MHQLDDCVLFCFVFSFSVVFTPNWFLLLRNNYIIKDDIFNPLQLNTFSEKNLKRFFLPTTLLSLLKFLQLFSMSSNSRTASALLCIFMVDCHLRFQSLMDSWPAMAPKFGNWCYHWYCVMYLAMLYICFKPVNKEFEV